MVPPPALLFYLVGREFNTPPWVIGEAPLVEVLQAYAIMAELQSKVKGGRSG